MSTDVLQNSTPTLWVDPDTRWASATCKVLDGSGSTLEEPSASVDSTSTTIASASNAFTVVLTSAAGVEAGRPYLITDDVLGERVVTVASVASTTVTFAEALPSTPSAGATFTGVRVSATLTTTSTASLGESLRVVFEGPAGEQRTAWFAVVRQVLPPAVDERTVRDILTNGYQAGAALQAAQTTRRVADLASQMVRDRLRQMTVWPHMVGDPAPLREAGRFAARLVLAEEYGTTPSNRDPDAYVGHLNSRLAGALAQVVHALGGVDLDDDGDFTDEAEAPAWSIQVVR